MSRRRGRCKGRTNESLVPGGPRKWKVIGYVCALVSAVLGVVAGDE